MTTMKIYPLLASILILASCSGSNESATGDMEPADTVNSITDTAPATSDSVIADAVTSATYKANAPTFNGVLIAAPNSSSATVALTMGGRIHSLNVMQGSAVAHGQVIATLDNPEFVDLQQSFIDAEIELEYLGKEYERQKSLGSQEAASLKRVQQSKAEYLSMKSKAEALSTHLKALGINHSSVKIGNIKAYLPITAPIAGYVTDINVNLGKYVDTGEPICLIVNKSQSLVELTVYEKDLNVISVGDIIDFRVNGMGKKTFSATVISIDQSVNKEDYSIKVYAKVKNPATSFRPGMYVRAKVRR